MVWLSILCARWKEPDKKREGGRGGRSPLCGEGLVPGQTTTGQRRRPDLVALQRQKRRTFFMKGVSFIKGTEKCTQRKHFARSRWNNFVTPIWPLKLQIKRFPPLSPILSSNLDISCKWRHFVFPRGLSFRLMWLFYLSLLGRFRSDTGDHMTPPARRRLILFIRNRRRRPPSPPFSDSFWERISASRGKRGRGEGRAMGRVKKCRTFQFLEYNVPTWCMYSK